MATGTYAGPVTVPAPSRRPGSASFSDVYPGFGPSTAAAGGEGAARERVALGAGGAPIAVDLGPDFLSRPAGWLVLGVVLIGALSYFDR